MNLALFDLDHTLLPMDSDYEWGQYLVRLGVVDADDYRRSNDRFYQQYHDGSLDIQEFLCFALRPLAQHPRAVLNEWHNGFMQEVIHPHIKPQARALVQQHQQAGDLCAIVTATNAFITRPIAQAFGIKHLIATEPEQDIEQGQFTGKVAGVPCFQAGKIVRTQAWLAQQGWGWHNFAQSTFYSDSANDLPLLEKVTTPVATNPSPSLQAVADQRGWKVLHLFHD